MAPYPQHLRLVPLFWAAPFWHCPGFRRCPISVHHPVNLLRCDSLIGRRASSPPKSASDRVSNTQCHESFLPIHTSSHARLWSTLCVPRTVSATDPDGPGDCRDPVRGVAILPSEDGLFGLFEVGLVSLVCAGGHWSLARPPTGADATVDRRATTNLQRTTQLFGRILPGRGYLVRGATRRRNPIFW